jgi:hypothetical protein
MSENWADRQRRTNQLARISANYIFKQKTVLPSQLYGLCQLTWITKSYEGENAKYIKRTKIPALGNIFQKDYSEATIIEVATDISDIIGIADSKTLIQSHTGFTYFYPPYRNSSEKWIEENYDLLHPLFKSVQALETDSDGLRLIREIERLHGIPKANYEDVLMHPEFLLTPVFFALDHRLRFPIINGNKNVRHLLSKLKVSNASLEKQYLGMIGLIGIGGIKDAADLDQVGKDKDLSDFINISGKMPTKKLLGKKPIDGDAELTLKDEADIESLQKARTVTFKRIHNKLTNQLKSCLADYTLFEGCDKSAMFDVLVKNYDGDKSDLLIEVKSSNEVPHIRMAVGQLFDYWFGMRGDSKHHMAILLPESPTEEVKKLLAWLDIGVLWFSGESLKTCCDWLTPLADEG